MSRRIQKTDVCLSLIGTMPLIFQIDERKLVFVGQICRLAADHVLRSIFYCILASYHGPFAHNRPQLGFIQSITQLLRKYSLEYMMFDFMQSGQFPAKNALSGCTGSSRTWVAVSFVIVCGFSCMKPVLLKPCELWVLGRNVSNLRRQCVASIHLICRLYSDNITLSCKLCKYGTVNTNIIEHLFASCKETVKKLLINGVL